MRIGVLGLGVDNSMACATVSPDSPLYTQYGCGGNVVTTGGGPCPTGFELDDTQTTCVPAGAVVNLGQPIPCLKGSGPLAPGQSYCPPAAATANLAPVAPCPQGFGLFNGVCLPLTSPTMTGATPPAAPTIIPGVPDWALYTVGGILALVAMKGMMGR